MGEGAFVLFINAPAPEEAASHPPVGGHTARHGALRGVGGACAGDRRLPEACREPRRASFWGLASGDSTVCALKEYQACCAEYAAVARYGRMISGWTVEKWQGSVWVMHMALFYNFGKYLTAADYERCQRMLAEDRSLPEITDNLRALCQGIRQRSAPSGETTAPWHSIILDISE